VAGANILGLGIGAGILRALSAMKLGLLAAIAAWGFGFGLGSWSNFRPFVARPPGSEPLSQAMVGGLLAAFFSLAGWWDVSKVAGEVRDPGRNLPRALLLGVATVTLVYILISAVFWYLVPLSLVDPDRGFAAQAGEALFGVAGGRIFSTIVILSVLGSLAGIIMAAPRVYYAMARDGVFPAALAAIHPRFGTPARATALQAIVASALVVSGSFEQILSYFMAVTIAFLALTVVVIYVLPGRPGAARVPGYPLTPLGFIVPVALIVVMRLVGDPIRSGIGMGIVAVGLPFYEIFLRGPSRIAAEENRSASPPST
jgi:basic amino acid/polyamine antiporter, APA family